MEHAEQNSRPIWMRIGFLVLPEDSTAPGSCPPDWATTTCCRIKTILWLAVSVVAAIFLGQLK